MKSISPAIVFVGAAVLLAFGRSDAAGWVGGLAALLSLAFWVPAFIIDLFFSDKAK